MAQNRTLAKVALLLTTLTCVSLAQDESPKVHRLNMDVDRVLVYATVTESARNRPVRGLEKKDFQILKTKSSRRSWTFHRRTCPSALGIIFDVSGSMKDKITNAQRAAATFFKSGTKQDEYFEVQFADRPKISSDFTNDVTKLQNSLLSVPTKGSTALYDAVYLGTEQAKGKQQPKESLLLITDGEDNRSRYSFGDVRSFIREQDVQLYAIGILDPATGAGRDALAQLTDITGGRAFFQGRRLKCPTSARKSQRN
jgi:Ca-activated chloride channel family protein